MMIKGIDSTCKFIQKGTLFLDIVCCIDEMACCRLRIEKSRLLLYSICENFTFIIKYMITYKLSRLSLFNARMYRCFSEFEGNRQAITKQDFKILSERAVYASQVVNTIINAEPNNDKSIFEDSLRDQILKLQVPGFECSPESRNYVLKIFDKGTILNQAVFNQPRIIQARQVVQKNKKKKMNPPARPFVFYPNMLVTRPMFQYLYQCDSNIMTLGNYGISKTVSIILFNILSSMINNYKYRAYSDPSQKSRYEQLVNQGLIWQVPKFFYWSIQKTTFNKNLIQKQLRKIILLQAQEISKEDKERLRKSQLPLDSFAEDLKTLYEERDIRTKIVIDQLNILASIMRNFNLFHAQFERTEEKYNRDILELERKLKTQKSQDQKNLIKQQIRTKEQNFSKSQSIYNQAIPQVKQNFKIPATNICSLMHLLTNLGFCAIYNSSITVEKNLVQTQKKFFQKRIFLQIEGHGGIPQKQVQYNAGLQQPWGRNDFYHFFWFEIQSRLSAKKIPAQRLANIKKQFYTKVQNKNCPRYYRFLNIRQLFKNNTDLLKFGKEINDQQISLKLDEIIKQFKLHSLRSCKKRIQGFFTKLQEGGLKILDKLTEILQKRAIKLIQNNDGDKYMQMDFADIQIQYDEQEAKIIRNLLIKAGQQNQQIMPAFMQNDNKNVTFQWTAHEYLQIYQLQKFKLKHQLVDFQQVLKFHIIQTNDVGRSFEHYLIQVLKSPKTVIKYTPYLSQQPLQQKRIQIQGAQMFTSFSLSKPFDTIQKYFERLRNFAEKTGKQKYILGLPFEKTQTGSWKFVQNNPSTDFVLFSFQILQQFNHYLIESFDATVTLKDIDIQEKIKKAIEIFSKILQLSNSQPGPKNIRYTLTHTIICRKQLIKDRKQFMQTISNKHKIVIKFVSIESIQVEYCENQKNLRLFRAAKDTALSFNVQSQVSV